MKCDNDHTRFNYFKLLKSFWMGYENMKCEQCNTTFEHKLFNRFLAGLISGVSILVSVLIFEEQSVVISMMAFILTALLFSLFTSFVMRFKRLQ
jgi:CXXC-20-CXXC protein